MVLVASFFPRGPKSTDKIIQGYNAVENRNIYFYLNFVLCLQIYKIYMLKYGSYAANSAC